MNFDVCTYLCNFKKMFFTVPPNNIVKIQYNIVFILQIVPGDKLCLSKDWTQMVGSGYVDMPA